MRVVAAAQPHHRHGLGAAFGHARGGAGQRQRRMLGQQHRGHAEMRGRAQDRAEVVRVADAVEPDRALRAGRQVAQPFRQRRRLGAQHVGDHAFVVRAGGKLLQVGLVDHAIADAVGDAPFQQRLQRRDARLAQVQLADRLRTPGEHRVQGIEAVQAQLGVAALARRRNLGVRSRRPTHRRARSPAAWPRRAWLGGYGRDACSRAGRGAPCRYGDGAAPARPRIARAARRASALARSRPRAACPTG